MIKERENDADKRTAGLLQERGTKLHLSTRLKVQLEEEIEELRGKIVSVSSPPVKDVVLENAADPYMDKKLRLIDERDRKQKELESTILRITWVDEVLDRMKDGQKRSLIISVLILGADAEKAAYSSGYSRSSFYRMMNGEICRSLISLKNGTNPGG